MTSQGHLNGITKAPGAPWPFTGRHHYIVYGQYHTLRTVQVLSFCTGESAERTKAKKHSSVSGRLCSYNDSFFFMISPESNLISGLKIGKVIFNLLPFIQILH